MLSLPTFSEADFISVTVCYHRIVHALIVLLTGFCDAPPLLLRLIHRLSVNSHDIKPIGTFLAGYQFIFIQSLTQRLCLSTYKEKESEKGQTCPLSSASLSIRVPRILV